MANEEISLFKFALKFGAIGAAVSIAATLLFFLLDMSEPPLLQYATYLLMLAIILWGQIEYRRAETLAIGYGESFGLGMLIVVYFAVLVTLYAILHSSFLDTGAMARVSEAAEAAMRSQNLPEDQMKIAMEFQEKLTGPVVTPILGSISIVFVGALISLITSIFTRRGEARPSG